MKKTIVALLVAVLVLTGCAAPVLPLVTLTPLQLPTDPPQRTAEPATPAPTETPAPPTATPLPPTATFTATPTLHPMAIEAMRQREYPGSEIVVEQQLESGSNYYRYYAYYLSEGLKIYGLLTVPYAEAPEGGYPAIVFNHGYIPPDVYVTTERYIAYVDNLARSGYVVFRIDYRGHDRSEGEPTGAYSNPGYAVDVLNAVASIKAYPGVNPEKIGMWGHSMGGYLTLRAMVISPDVKAGVIWAGVVASYPDMLSRWRRDRPSTPAPGARGWRTAWIEQFGAPESNPQFWASISANSYVNELNGRPIQLHHGTLDEDVPLLFSELLASELQAAGQPYEFYIYEGDNHNISNSFSVAMQRTIAFFDAHLK